MSCASLGPVERRQWIVLLAIVCLLVGWNYWLDEFFISTPYALYGGGFGDFEVFRLAGAAWLSHGNPYVTSRGFIYPPTSLPFFAIYALFPFHFAGQLWWITYFTFFVAACISLGSTLKDKDRLLFATVVTLLFFTSYPLLNLFQLGQSDLLTAALAVMSLACLRSKHGFASAMLLSLAVLLKGPAVLLLTYFVLFRRDLSYLLRFLLSVLVIVGASLLIVPVDDYWYYLGHVVPTFSGVLANANESVGGLLAMMRLSFVASVVSFGGFILFAFFSYWVGARRLPLVQESLSSDAMFLFSVLVMLLFGPRSTVYPYVWVILPLALFLSAILMEHIRPEFLALIGVGAFLLNSNLVPGFLNYEVLSLELVGNIITSLCLLFLYVRPTAIIGTSTA